MRPGRGRPSGQNAPFDPSGLASYDVVLRASIPKEGRDKVSSGHVIVRKPINRVPWAGVTITGTFVGLRALTLLLPVAILGLAVLLFDRFDPARGGGLRKLLKKRAVEPKEAVALGPLDAISLASLSPIRATPSFLSAVLAETRLLWDSAPRTPVESSLLAAIAAALSFGRHPLSAALVLLSSALSGKRGPRSSRERCRSSPVSRACPALSSSGRPAPRRSSCSRSRCLRS
jgi:hypothetical protein